jgi:hypothetical protein
MPSDESVRRRHELLCELPCLSNLGLNSTQTVMIEPLTSKDCLIMRSFGIWGLVGLGIIATDL